MTSTNRVLVIGAGVGGLTAAAVLARSGVDVTVLEAHVHPGGCAGTFFHKGYRFDAGATLAGGFYPGGPMDLLAQAVGIAGWPARSADPAMVVHLPGGVSITRWTDEERWEERRVAFGPHSETFWRWQERTADAIWELALRTPPWPPQSVSEGLQLVQKGVRWLHRDLSNRLIPQLLADAVRPVAAHLKPANERLRLFVDAQLLISAQTTSATANALYGASALDLPRRGVVHLEGGMGAIGETLVEAVRRNGGQVLFRHKAHRITVNRSGLQVVETERGGKFFADLIVANLPPWNIARLVGHRAPRSLQKLPPRPKEGWGAFMVYAGLDGSGVPDGFPLHHQVVVQEPLADGNTLFLSLSPAWDKNRAPDGRRALTISTHTDLGIWWELFERDRPTYERRKLAYTERLLNAAAIALPGLRDAVELVLPGTPVTFQRFTSRDWGWVGGFPQTHLFRTWGPRLTSRLWMVGDSVFPGQSTAAVALGGMRVAQAVMRELGSVRRRVASRSRLRRILEGV